jgi:2-isopropylmalate synthase
MFDELVQIGFEEIEVGFPSASQTDYDFVRQLIEEQAIPDDVTIQVLTQARPELITRTFEAVRGAPRAILHVDHAAAPIMRRVVFGLSKDEVIEQLALRHVRLIQQLANGHPETQWTFQYSPEMFSDTELEFSLRIVDAVTSEWAPVPEKPCIINLTATVESCTANVFGDMVEWMHTHIARRDAIVLLVHPHNVAELEPRRRSRRSWLAWTGWRVACLATANAPGILTWSTLR